MPNILLGEIVIQNGELVLLVPGNEPIFLGANGSVHISLLPREDPSIQYWTQRTRTQPGSGGRIFIKE